MALRDIGPGRLNLQYLYVSAITLTCLIGPAATEAEEVAGTLCAANETPVFSCAIGHKTVSVCASKDLSSTSGYLIYRFGRSLDKPEMAYPSEGKRPQESFAFVDDESSAHASLEQLSFSIGGYSYTIVEERAAFESTSDGVLVKVGDKKIAFLRCNSPASPDGPSGLYRLREIGLPHGRLEFDYP